MDLMLIKTKLMIIQILDLVLLKVDQSVLSSYLIDHKTVPFMGRGMVDNAEENEIKQGKLP